MGHYVTSLYLMGCSGRLKKCDDDGQVGCSGCKEKECCYGEDCNGYVN